MAMRIIRSEEYLWVDRRFDAALMCPTTSSIFRSFTICQEVLFPGRSQDHAIHIRFREREKFETEWARIRTVVVVPALEEIKALLSKAGWQCEARADKDQGVHFTIFRGNVKGERPYMTFQPEKSKDAIVIYVATRGSGSHLGNFTVDQITQDFVQTEALKFFERLTSELSTPAAHERSHQPS